MTYNKQLLDFSLKQNVVCINDSNDSFPMVLGYIKIMITLHHAASSLLNDIVSNTKVRVEVCDFVILPEFKSEASWKSHL
jgi:hypothetical protein